MSSRCASSSLAVQSFASSRLAARSTEPEVFTFERVPAQATALRSTVPLRPRKRCTRVMYPAKVRMHLPPPERSQAKRWLVVLVLVVLWQIYTEDPGADAAPSGSDGALSVQFPFQPAESGSGSEQSFCRGDGASDPHLIQTSTCPTSSEEPESRRGYEQGAGKSYMVALLVYHRLGSDN